MKLHKTLTLAALVAGSLLAADLTVRAQESTNTPSATSQPPGAPEKKGNARGRMSFDIVSNQLQLSEDQKPKVRPILQDMAKQLAALRGDTSLTQADRRAKTAEIRNDATAKLKEILTPEQLAQWQKLAPARRTLKTDTTPPAAGQN